MIDGLYQVTTPYLCAGYVVQNGQVTECAPVLRRKLHYWTTKGKMVGEEIIDFTDKMKTDWVAAFAIDPGETTGWTALAFEKKTLRAEGEVHCINVARNLSTKLFAQGDVDCSEENEGALDLLVLMEKWKGRVSRFVGSDVPLYFITESFQLRAFTGTHADPNLLSPVRILAKIEWALWDRERTGDPLAEYSALPQSAANAKGVITDKRLRRWGLWQPGKRNRHKMDSLRHMILWMRSL